MNKINKYILFLLSFFLLAANINAQNPKVDSLKIELKSHKKKDTTRVNLLYKLAFSNFQRDLELTKLYLAEAEDLSNNLNYTKGKGRVLYLKGILESRKSNYPKSLAFFKRALKHYESIQYQNGIASIYTSFGITHFIQSEYEEAINDIKKATEIYEAIGNKKELNNILIIMGNVYTQTGEYTEAISNYSKALKEYKLTANEEGASYVYRNIAVVYKMQGNYPLAIDNYNKALDYLKKTNDTLGMAIQLNNLGDAYKFIEKFDKAVEYSEQSLNFALQVGNKNLIVTNNNNLGNIYLQQEAYKKALKHFQISLKTSQEINIKKQTATCFNNIGQINLLLNEPLIARQNFIKAKDISHEINSNYVLSVSYLGIANTYLHEKKYKKAENFALKGQKIAEELELLENQKKATYILYSIYKTTKDYKKALENHQQYKILNDSLFNKETIEKITQLEYEYKYKNELELAEKRELKLTKTVKTTSQNLEKTQRNLFLGVIGFLITALVLGTIIFFLKLRNEKSKTQNVVIEQKLLRSQMTPHFIFNSLSVLQGMILNKEDKKSISYLSKFSKLLRITLENSRDKMVSLSHELIAIKNYLALQDLENENYQYTVSVSDTVDKTLFKVPPMLIQPFVENAIEHAFINQKENKKIDVQLEYVNKELICTITDNGIGIKPQKEKKDQHKTSLSTTITSERLKIVSKDLKMKGSVTIENRQKYNAQGTIVTLIIPYIKENA